MSSSQTPKWDMMQRKDVEGKIYEFRSKSESTDPGSEISDVPALICSLMVLVLDVVPGRKGYVKIMPVSHNFFHSHHVSQFSRSHPAANQMATTSPSLQQKETLSYPTASSKSYRLLARKTSSCLSKPWNGGILEDKRVL